MANRIRGITIQIGGDTTKLDKALAGTNKELATTQKSLKDVERLLKLDPGNTELLEQKQRLLAQAAEGTAQKLNTLRQAAENADKALERGTAYQNAYEPLKRELDTVTASIRALESNADSMKKKLDAGDISTSQYDAFAQKLDDTRARANELEKAIADVNKEFSGAKINKSQYDALQRELAETELAAEDAEKAFDEFNASAQKFNSTAGTISEGAGKIQSATQGISTAAAGVLAAAAATVPATEEIRNSLSILETNARNVGVGIGSAQAAMQNFVVVSGELDSSLEATSNLLQAGFTESNLQMAVENLAGAYLSFPDTLKIESLADSLQETLATGSATGQFAELLDRLGVGAENFTAQLSMMSSETDRQNYALGVLASQGLSSTYEGWVQNNQALIENRRANYEFQMAMAELAETIQPFLKMIVELGTQVLDFFNSLPSGVQAAIAVVLVLIAVISPIAGIVSSVAAAVGAAGVAMTSWLPIILAVTAALIALAAIIAMITGAKIPDAESITGQSSSSVARSRSVSMPTDIPKFADGGLIPPNNPFLAVLGDNTREPEIVAPYSTLKQAAGDAMDERSVRSTPVEIIVKAKDGFTRNLSFALSEESARQGVKLVNTRG